jgi:hypothetical protein
MILFEVGDLVEVKKNNALSPTLRFFHNKKGFLVRISSESHKNNKVFSTEWEILFSDGKRAIFKDYEICLIAKAGSMDEYMNEK